MITSFLNHFKDFCLKSHLYRPLIITLILNLLIWCFLIKLIPISSSWIPLHANVYFGIDWLGPWIYIFIYPALALIFALINFILAMELQAYNLFLSRLILWISLIIQLIVTLGLVFLIISNFS